MAERIYFYVENNKVKTGSVEFEWFPGFAVSQKQKSIASMHRAISETRSIAIEKAFWNWTGSCQRLLHRISRI